MIVTRLMTLTVGAQRVLDFSLRVGRDLRNRARVASEWT